jgi:hypothetical protein
LPDEVIESRGDQLKTATRTLNRYFVFYRARQNGVRFSPSQITFRENELFEVIEAKIKEGTNGRSN